MECAGRAGSRSGPRDVRTRPSEARRRKARERLASGLKAVGKAVDYFMNNWGEPENDEDASGAD